MDFRLFFTTFLTVFLAEMGDKTQLTAMSLTAGGASKLNTFLACSLALVCSTALAVIAGEMLGQYVPVVWLKRVAGVGFLLMGTVVLVQSRAG